MSQIAPMGAEEIGLSDEELGRRLLDWAIAHKAEELGLDPWAVPAGFADSCVSAWRQIPDEPPSEESSPVLLAIQYAANLKFAAAGKLIRQHIERGAEGRSAFLNVERLRQAYGGEQEVGEATVAAVVKLVPALGKEIEQAEAQKRREHAQSLRKKGYSWKKMGEELGISQSTARDLVDPQRKK